jgi:phenylacetate-CoA ligase
MPHLTYFDAVDYPRMRADYPLGDALFQRFGRMSRDELFALRDRRFRDCLALGWRTPFYRRLWGAAGLEPGDVVGLADIERLPTYSKSDLMASVARHPPFGDFNALESMAPEQRPPVVVQTTSGTTGRPQPLIFGAWTREVQNLLLARLYHMQGVRPDDVVHSVYGHGMINGGHYIREAVIHWTGARLLSAGTGVETRSATQVELMRDFGVTVLAGFGDYVRRLADVAREQGIEPGRDIRLRLISGHVGSEGPGPLSAAWGGVDVFDWYGVGDTGAIAGQGQDRDGLYVMEDAHVVELIDPDTGAAVSGRGAMCVTCLFTHDVFPIIRFNTYDVSEYLDGEGAIGLPFRRLRGFLGRADNMVKLRGINVFPTAIGAVLAEGGASGDYLCRVRAVGGRDEMTVLVETRDMDAGVAVALADLLRRRLGVEVGVELHPPGALAPLTGIETRQKPIRLVDERTAPGRA